MKTITFIFLSTLLTISTSIRAHEFWLEAHPFMQKTNQTTEITIHVGENMNGDLQPNIPAWYSNFDIITADGIKEVDGELGRDPAGYFKTKTQGIYAIGYQSTRNTVDLPAEKFEEYLTTQGLEKIIEQRKISGESNKNGQEAYYRNAKTLIKIGDRQDVNFYDYDFSYPLNIKPLQNPYELTQGDTLSIQITFNQKPAADLLLQAKVRHRPDFQFSIRTDKQGIANIPLTHQGVWLLHTVEMTPSNESNLDWVSYWGSLTFEISSSPKS